MYNWCTDRWELLPVEVWPISRATSRVEQFLPQKMKYLPQRNPSFQDVCRIISHSKNKSQKDCSYRVLTPNSVCIRICCMCVSGVPVQVFAVLHVEQHGRDQFVHVLWLPDNGLQLVVHRLSHHTLQTFNPCHPDPDTDTQWLSDMKQKSFNSYSKQTLKWVCL